MIQEKFNKEISTLVHAANILYDNKFIREKELTHLLKSIYIKYSSDTSDFLDVEIEIITV